MIKESSITQEAQDYIKGRLLELEKQENIKILLAVESGSRAWGFPSKDSDYDIRFIYKRSVDDYLTISPARDMIETPIVEDEVLGVKWDMVGWDIGKALKLAVKSNFTVSEWLKSPVIYTKNHLIQTVCKYTEDNYCLLTLAFKYQRWAKKISEENKGDGSEIKVKHYCYILRLLLSVDWIEAKKTIPPMDVFGLCSGLSLERNFVEEFAKLIELKSQSNEGDIINRIDVLDDYIDRILGSDIEKPELQEVSDSKTKQANMIFREIIKDE